MINNFHLDIKQIFEAAPPEQKILINMVSRIVGERASYQQFYFNGAINAELQAYSANRLYLIFDSEFANSLGTMSSGAIMTLYDQNNTASMYHTNLSGIWDATAAAAKAYRNNLRVVNYYFSRLTLGPFAACKLIGFKIIY